MLDTSTLSRDGVRKSIIEDIPTYKILIIGDQGIGKTSLIHRYIFNKFMEGEKHTLGLDFQEKIVQVSPESRIKLIIWDTVGSEKFGAIAQNFFTNSDGIILCFDITNNKSFQNLDSWINYINEYVEIKDDNNNKIKKKDNNNNEDEEEENEEEEKDWIDDDQFKPIIILSGTKSDLIDNKNVSIEDIKELNNIIKCEYFLTSAKNGNGVEDLFFFMAKELFDKKTVIDKNKKGFKLRSDKYGSDDQCHSKARCC